MKLNDLEQFLQASENQHNQHHDCSKSTPKIITKCSARRAGEVSTAHWTKPSQKSQVNLTNAHGVPTWYLLRCFVGCWFLGRTYLLHSSWYLLASWLPRRSLLSACPSPLPGCRRLSTRPATLRPPPLGG